MLAELPPGYRRSDRMATSYTAWSTTRTNGAIRTIHPSRLIVETLGNSSRGKATMRDSGSHPLAVAALQARSIAARGPLARAAGVPSAAEIIAGEAEGEAADPWIAGELARVIALQDLRAD